LASFVAQRDILQQAALFVTHGGGNSVYEAIYCATPMIVVPQITEQQIYARQIERIGLGKSIATEDLTAPLLRSTVMDALTDDRLRRNAEALKETLPKIPPAIPACDRIEAIAVKAKTAC